MMRLFDLGSEVQLSGDPEQLANRGVLYVLSITIDNCGSQSAPARNVTYLLSLPGNPDAFTEADQIDVRSTPRSRFFEFTPE